MRKLSIVQSADLTSSLLRLTPDQKRKLLSRLSRGGLIARVRQGLYLVSQQCGYEWIRYELKAKRVDAMELIKTTLCYGDAGTLRRMGVLLEDKGINTALLRKLNRALNPTSSLIPWIPGRPKRGTANRRWGVIING